MQLRIRTVVREDAFDLFGFLTAPRRRCSSCSPRCRTWARGWRMTCSPAWRWTSWSVAHRRGEVARLTKIHGVGKKTAERLVLELKDKVKPLPPGRGGRGGHGADRPASAHRADLVSALVNLGYKPPQAEKAADVAAERAGAEAAFEALFREALKALRQG